MENAFFNKRLIRKLSSAGVFFLPETISSKLWFKTIPFKSFSSIYIFFSELFAVENVFPGGLIQNLSDLVHKLSKVGPKKSETIFHTRLFQKIFLLKGFVRDMSFPKVFVMKNAFFHGSLIRKLFSSGVLFLKNAFSEKYCPVQELSFWKNVC